jgi:hypothetical protein
MHANKSELWVLGAFSGQTGAHTAHLIFTPGTTLKISASHRWLSSSISLVRKEEGGGGGPPPSAPLLPDGGPPPSAPRWTGRAPPLRLSSAALRPRPCAARSVPVSLTQRHPLCPRPGWWRPPSGRGGIHADGWRSCTGRWVGRLQASPQPSRCLA